MKYGKYNTGIKLGRWRLINWFHWGDAALRNPIDAAAAPQRRFILRRGRSSLFSRFWIHCSVEEMSEKHWFLLCTALTLAFSPRSAVVVCVFGTSLNRDEKEVWCEYRILSISGFLIRWPLTGWFGGCWLSVRMHSTPDKKVLLFPNNCPKMNTNTL